MKKQTIRVNDEPIVVAHIVSGEIEPVTVPLRKVQGFRIPTREELEAKNAARA